MEFFHNDKDSIKPKSPLIVSMFAIFVKRTSLNCDILKIEIRKSFILMIEMKLVKTNYWDFFLQIIKLRYEFR